MKQHLILALSLCLCCGSALAQPRSASEPQKLLEDQSGLMAPVWSPSGDMIAVTTDNYNGILVANADGSGKRSITDAQGAGYKMAWSADGKEILGRTNILENQRVMHEVKTWSVADGAEKTLVAKSRGIKGTPTWKSVGGKAALAGDAYEAMVSDPAGAAAQIEGLKEFAGKVIINPALSPDGKKVAFQIPGKGIYVCDADGSNLKSLVNGKNPSWCPDSRSIVYAVVTDNGESFTSGKLYAIDVDGGSPVLLLGDSKYVALTPAVSPDGGKVAFENAIDASIYVINLKY